MNIRSAGSLPEGSSVNARIANAQACIPFAEIMASSNIGGPTYELDTAIFEIWAGFNAQSALLISLEETFPYWEIDFSLAPSTNQPNRNTITFSNTDIDCDNCIIAVWQTLRLPLKEGVSECLYWRVSSEGASVEPDGSLGGTLVAGGGDRSEGSSTQIPLTIEGSGANGSVSMAAGSGCKLKANSSQNVVGIMSLFALAIFLLLTRRSLSLGLGSTQNRKDL